MSIEGCLVSNPGFEAGGASDADVDDVSGTVELVVLVVVDEGEVLEAGLYFSVSWIGPSDEYGAESDGFESDPS
jgi:hypothetical protein